MEGTIKSLMRDKGFGFIKVSGHADVFFHRSGIEKPDHIDQFNEGDAVSFEMETSPKGPRATNVRLT